MRRKIVAGNWKMNGLRAGLNEIALIKPGAEAASAEVVICPPATLIAAMADAAGPIAVGGQDCHPATHGAHTGDVSAAMIADAGGRFAIVGHSERRADHGETDQIIHAKAEAAWAAGLTAIICVGETEAERDAGRARDVVATQLAGSVPDGATAANTVIAYEPVWAIGTGRVPVIADIADMHDHLRAALVTRFADGDGFRILYGGSVKGSNAAEIFAVENVDGGLVGGASLQASDFLPIIAAAG